MVVMQKKVLFYGKKTFFFNAARSLGNFGSYLYQMIVPFFR